MQVSRFSFYEYVDEIKGLIEETYSPPLKSVLFAPLYSAGSEISVDIAVPAFVMNFEDPTPKGRVPAEVEEGFYLNFNVNLCGYLILPKYKTEGQNERNLNMSITLMQAACNIGALIAGKAEGWNCGVAVVESIMIQDDDNFHVAEIKWSHDAVAGKDLTCPFDFDELTVNIKGPDPKTDQKKIIIDSSEVS